MLMLYNDGAQVHTGYIDRTNVVLITQCIKKQRDSLERQISDWVLRKSRLWSKDCYEQVAK